MKCSICKRDLGKGYNGAIYKVNNKFICEDCAEKIARQGGFKKILEGEATIQQVKNEIENQNKEEIEKEKKKKEYEEKMKELQNKYKDIL